MKLTIQKKIVIGFAIVISITIAAHAYVLCELYSLANEAQTTLTFEVRALDLAKRLRALLNDEDGHARKYLITRDRAYYHLFQDASREFQKLLVSLVLTEAERGKLLHRVAESHALLSRAIQKVASFGKGARGAAHATDDSARKDSIEFIDRALQGLARINQLSIDGSLLTFVEATQRATSVAAALTVATILAASLAAWMIARTITRPISTLVEATEQIARGVFEPIRVGSHDETALLAGAVNEMSARLKKVNEGKADLMYQIVHELRNPLQVIFFARNLLAEQEVGEVNRKQLEMLDLIDSNAEKLMSFTNQFLDLAKIDAGMMEYRRTPVDLAVIVERAVKDARALAGRKEVSIAFKADPAPEILADAEKLAQVFTNLLSNAIKYTERGGTIEVAVSRFDRASRVTVKDSGIGIAADELPKLFTKFYQASNAAEARAKGTGLGLALVKAFVENHGGTVSVASTLGVGSIFTVEFPLADMRQGIAA
jgi:two-component system sensor histidine kinase GlrK